MKSSAISTLRWSLLLALLSACHLARAQSYPPAWSGAASYVIGDQAQASGNVYRCIKAVSSTTGPTSDYAHWELYFVRANTTLTIGVQETFPSLASAWTYAQNAKVADGAYLHFYISSAHSGGVYSESFSAPLLLDHSSGARLAILGDSTGDTLSFGATNGIIIDTGHSFNTISTLTISGTGPDGIKADYAATLSLLSNATISGFQNGVHALQGGAVTLQNNCTFTHINDYCCLAEASGNIVALDGLTISASSANPSFGAAFGATNGGVIVAESCSVSYYSTMAQANFGGTIDVKNSTAANCTNPVDAAGGSIECSNSHYSASYIGILAQDGGAVDAQDCSVQLSTTGADAQDHGYIDCQSSTFSANQVDVIAVTNGVIYVATATYTTTFVDSGNGSYIIP
jgi:hypothetical protein